MAEQDNLRVAREALAAISAHNVEAYLNCLDNSYTGESETMGVIHGVEGARKMLTMLLQAFPDLKYEIEELIPSGDRVVVRSLLSGTHRGTFAGIAPTSKQVTWRSCVVVEFRNGKAVRSRTYADNLSLLQQLGAISLPRAAGA